MSINESPGIRKITSQVEHTYSAVDVVVNPGEMVSGRCLSRKTFERITS